MAVLAIIAEIAWWPVPSGALAIIPYEKFEELRKSGDGWGGIGCASCAYNYLSDTNLFFLLLLILLAAACIVLVFIFRRRLPPASRLAAYVGSGIVWVISFLGGLIQVGIWLGLLPDHIH